MQDFSKIESGAEISEVKEGVISKIILELLVRLTSLERAVIEHGILTPDQLQKSTEITSSKLIELMKISADIAK